MGVQLSVTGSYRPPVLELGKPPHMSIMLPVQTAVWLSLGLGKAPGIGSQESGSHADAETPCASPDANGTGSGAASRASGSTELSSSCARVSFHQAFHAVFATENVASSMRSTSRSRTTRTWKPVRVSTSSPIPPAASETRSAQRSNSSGSSTTRPVSATGVAAARRTSLLRARITTVRSGCSVNGSIDPSRSRCRSASACRRGSAWIESSKAKRSRISRSTSAGRTRHS